MTAAANPVLYSFRRCPCAMRARLALAIGNIRCEIREVKLAAKPEAMLSASPKGTVPVLVLSDGKVIDESLDIMRWALARSDPEEWLTREDTRLIASNDRDFKRELDRCKYPNRYGADAIAHRQKGLLFLQQLEDRLAGGQLCGSKRGITDAAVMPFVRQFVSVDRTWFDAQPLPKLRDWLGSHMSSPLFEAIMVRLAPWAPDHEPIVWPTMTAPI